MKRKVEFSRSIENGKVAMYGATERYCFLGERNLEDILPKLSKHQQGKIKKLFEKDLSASADVDVEYMKADEVVLIVDTAL